MNRRRTGASLVEMLVVISLMSFILGLVAVTMHTMYRGDRRLRERIGCCTSLAQLSIQFRSDAHQAIRVERAPDASGGKGAGLLLTMPGRGTVLYQVNEERVERTVVRDQKWEHREVYTFPRGSTTRCEIADEQSPPIAVLVVTRPAAVGSPALVDAEIDRIEAAAGLHQHYLSEEEP